MAQARKTVFISYAHEDRKWADELLKFFAPWLREGRVELWDDSKISFGFNWQTEIQKVIDQASVAVLLITKNFLASEFIMKYELPALLERAKKNQIRIAWIAVGYSGVETTKLWEFQAVNNPAQPLEILSKARRDETMVEIAKVIADSATIGTFASGLQIIDETTEPILSAIEKRPERKDQKFGVQANYKAKENIISFTGANEIIRVEDLSKLPDDDREYIADLEDSLKTNYERWKRVRKSLGDAGGALDGEVSNQLNRITRLICKDLNTILDFLEKMHKYELQDHYGRYRHICSMLPNE